MRDAFWQHAQAGFVAERSEVLSARLQPPADCPSYFLKRHQPPVYRSRSSCLMTLPIALRGSDSTKTTRRGSL